MTQILRTTRLLPTEPVSWEAYQGIGGTGAPSYATAVSVLANVVPYDAVGGSDGSGDQYVIAPDGTREVIALTLYFVGDVTNVPGKGDRVTWSGATYVVVEKVTVSGLFYTAAEPDHYEIRCRAE
jgi:hypothetical protein